MEKKSKRVRIVGKGHSTCFGRVLEEWYRQEIFTDVVLTCDENIEHDSHLSSKGDTCRRIHANKSVLAAASPTLAHIFSQSSSIEDDTRLVFTGYSFRTLRNVVEFIYTGAIEINKNEKMQVEELMQELSIKVPFASETAFPFSSPMPIQVVVTTPEDFNEIEQPLIALEDPLAVSPITPASNKFLDAANHEVVTISSTPEPNQQPIMKWQKRKSTPSVSHSGRKMAKTDPKPKASPAVMNTEQSADVKTLKESAETPSNNGEKITNKAESTTKPDSPIDLELVISAPVNQKVGSLAQRQESIVIRMLNRKIDGVYSLENVTFTDPLQKEYTCLGLSKSFAEKTLTVVGNALVPPVTLQHNGFQRRNTLQEAMRTSHFRDIVNALSESPGLYTTYRERVFPFGDTYYEPTVNWMGNSLHVKSYFNKDSKRSYLEKSNGCPWSQFPSLIDLASCLNGKTIQSLIESNGKVHIQLAGDPLVNQSSEALFEDSPLFSLSKDEIKIRLSFEHNYSTGESEQPAASENPETKCQEQSDDLNTFKRSVQLSINEQRRNNRLRKKAQMLNKKVSILKEKAIDLLISRRDAQERAKASVSHQRPKKKATIDSASPATKPEIRVPCGICNKIVKKNWLKRHLIIAHSNERNHLCDECGRTFALKGQLTSHQLRQHKTKPGNHICDQCGRTFRFLRYLNRHMSLHSDLKPHACPYCDKTFRLKTVLTKHIRTHTGERPYHCSMCGRSFRQRTTYARHLKMHEKMQDSGCGEVDGGSPGSLPRLKCEFCSMTFRLDLFRMLHRAKHTGETPCLPCPTCSMTFPSIKELSCHRKIEHPETVYACHLCPKIFTNKPNFDFHVLKHTDPNAIKKRYPLKPTADSGPCVCEFCEKVFKSRVSLDYHIKGIHLNGRTFRCEFCDKTLTSKAAYEHHKRTHEGELLYKCEVCPSAFKEQLMLDAHLAVHTAEPLFICPHCEKQFTNETALYAHIRIHTGSRLECSFCQKILPSVDQLAIHEETCPMSVAEASVV